MLGVRQLRLFVQSVTQLHRTRQLTLDRTEQLA